MLVCYTTLHFQAFSLSRSGYLYQTDYVIKNVNVASRQCWLDDAWPYFKKQSKCGVKENQVS